MAKMLKGLRSIPALPNSHAAGNSLSELNAWLTENYASLRQQARRNCLRLTGKATFGSKARARKIT